MKPQFESPLKLKGCVELKIFYPWNLLTLSGKGGLYLIKFEFPHRHTANGDISKQALNVHDNFSRLIG